MNILDEYVLKSPNKQNVLDIFADEWSSMMPAGSDCTSTPGRVPLFNDGRITWALGVLGDIKDKRVLELGPLEAGHSYMFADLGAKEVTAIEANTRAYLKCLCIKEIFGLKNVNFHLGDFVKYLEESSEKYDLLVACGVLYHMKDPIHVLDLISQKTDKVFLWTHYYDADPIKSNEQLSHKFQEPETFEYNGFSYEAVEQSYKDALEWSGFCGGPLPTSRWLSRESLVGYLKHVGFKNLEFNWDEPNHPNGPAVAICASR